MHATSGGAEHRKEPVPLFHLSKSLGRMVAKPEVGIPVWHIDEICVYQDLAISEGEHYFRFVPPLIQIFTPSIGESRIINSRTPI